MQRKRNGTMAVLFKTNAPQALLNDFKKKIDVGLIDTWSYDKHGGFTLTPDQWRHTAWMVPSFDASGLCFKILGHKLKITTKRFTASSTDAWSNRSRCIAISFSLKQTSRPDLPTPTFSQRKRRKNRDTDTT
jgi:hypothetical protein